MPGGRNSGSITEAMNSTVISGTPRTNSMKPTDTQRTIGILRAPAQRQQDAERERAGDADGGDDQRHQQAAPQRRVDMRQARARRPTSRKKASTGKMANT